MIEARFNVFHGGFKSTRVPIVRHLMSMKATSASSFSKHSFDYIIVGGGTVGLALAVLLAQDATISVGVIEAGEKCEDDKILIPGLIGQTLGDPKYDWNFLSTPQSNAENRQIPMFRGKMLGGTSALNYMAFTRGSHVEHDGWEQLGVQGWDWEVVKKTIAACEKWTPPPPAIVSQYYANDDRENHGRKGYIATSSHAFYYDITRPMFETMNILGIQTNQCAASGNPIGVWTETASVNPVTRVRSYSANAYLEPNENKPNLAVLTGAYASRVMLLNDDDIVNAIGVEYISNGNLFKVEASREVILCAGSIQTPQVLELSGIGNSDIITSFGIIPRVDLKGVGENLQDHINVSPAATLVGQHITAEDMQNPDFAAAQWKLYRESKSGMLSATPSTFVFLDAKSFIPEDVLDRMISALDRELEKGDYPASPWRKAFELQRAWLTSSEVAQLEIVLFPAYFGKIEPRDKDERHYTLSVFLQHCWSRGSVHINSSDPQAPPVIDLAILKSPADIDLLMLVQAIKYAFKIMKTDPLGAETQRIIEPLPTATDEELAQYVREHVTSAWHPTGTAAMLPRENNGVVNEEFMVYGTNNLRVVDASVIPIQLGTHPQSTLYGFAHRAADIIRGRE